MARIALDAMGGDRAPDEIISGALVAAQRGVGVTLVGDLDLVAPILDAAGAQLPMVHAPDSIGMGDDPTHALREKRQSSIAVAARLVREGEVDGMVSAGPTGAALAASAMFIGRLKGVLRPAIAAVLPLAPAGRILLDAGANPDCRPEHLHQFAIMGAALAEARLGLTEPRVGLLNIGHEEGKGRDLEKAAYELLRTAPIHFVGNVEARHLADGEADVIVTDGFTGNNVLKAGEGTVALMSSMMRAEMMSVAEDHPDAAQSLATTMRGLRDRMDPESYGGASLVGVKGAVTVAHGSSSRTAIANALEMTDEEIKRGLVKRTAAGLEG